MGQEPVVFLDVIGSMATYLTLENPENVQPVKATFSLIPPFEIKMKNKMDRNNAYIEHAQDTIQNFVKSV